MANVVDGCAVGVPHWEQYATDPSSTPPHFVQYMFVSVMDYAIWNEMFTSYDERIKC